MVVCRFDSDNRRYSLDGLTEIIKGNKTMECGGKDELEQWEEIDDDGIHLVCASYCGVMVSSAIGASFVVVQTKGAGGFTLMSIVSLGEGVKADKETILYALKGECRARNIILEL